MTMMVSRWRVAPVALLLIVLTTGCEWVPVRRRLDPSLYPIPSPKRLLGRSSPESPRSPDEVDTVGAIDDDTLPPLPPLAPLTDEQALALPAETPLLDAALVRAQDLRELTLSGFDEPDPMESQAPKRVLRLPDAAPAPAPPQHAPESSPEPLTIEPLPDLEPLPVEASMSQSFEPLGSRDVRDQSEPDESDLVRPDRQGVNLWQTVVALLAEPEHLDRASGLSNDPVAEPKMRISDIRFCQEVRGFGEYQELEPADFQAGRWAILYCEVEGVHYERDEDVYRSCLATQLELFRAGSEDEPLWVSSWMAPETCSKPRRDYFVSYRFRWPVTLPSGSYQLRLSQHDLSNDQNASVLVPIAIRP